MTTELSDAARHPIRVVAKRTGLTTAVLRAWEKRYRVVVPGRTEGGQRLYSDDDVLRLSLLRRAVEEGRSISRVAGLTTEELQGIVREDEAERRVPGPPQALTSSSATDILEQAQRAVDEMDPGSLERTLTRGAMNLSVPTMIDEVVSPLLSSIGTSWRNGRFGPAHEHVSTVVIRRFLDWLQATVAVGEGAPVLIAATPAGERHELGALLSAVSGAAEGWRSVYLGPDLPADEITLAALRLDATAVALSCVERKAAEGVVAEVRDLRRRLPPDVHLFVGGPVADEYRKLLMDEGIDVLHSQQGLRQGLQVLSRSL